VDSTDTPAIRGTRWREGWWLALAELAVVIALTVGHRLVPLSTTPFLLVLRSLSRRMRDPIPARAAVDSGPCVDQTPVIRWGAPRVEGEKGSRFKACAVPPL